MGEYDLNALVADVTSVVRDVERLLVEAKRLGLTRTDVVSAIEARWDALFADEAGARR